VSASTSTLPEKKATPSPYRNRSYAESKTPVAAPPKEKAAGGSAPVRKYRNKSVVSQGDVERKAASKAALPVEATPIRAMRMGSTGAGGSLLSPNSTSGGSSGEASAIASPVADAVESARRATLHLLGIQDGGGEANEKPTPPATKAMAPVIVTTRTPYDPEAAKLLVHHDDATEAASTLHAPPNITPIVTKASEKKVRPAEIIRPAPSSPVFHAPKDIAEHAVIDPHAPHEVPPFVRELSFKEKIPRDAVSNEPELHAPTDIASHTVVDHHAKKPYRNRSYASGTSKPTPAVTGAESGELHAPKDIASHAVVDHHAKKPYRNRSYAGGATPSFMASTKSSVAGNK
jgi:hypothetical protein